VATTPTVEELETRFALGLREHIIGSLETHVDRTLFDWEEANPPPIPSPRLGFPKRCGNLPLRTTCGQSSKTWRRWYMAAWLPRMT